MRKIRDDGERDRWVQQWRHSRLTAKAFSDRHGLSVASLYRWARGELRTAQQPGLEPVMRFVEAVPVGGREGERGWAWEFEGPSGVLRGRALDDGALTELLAAATRRST